MKKLLAIALLLILAGCGEDTPTVSFEVPESAFATQQIHFENTSSDASYFEWSFGDGGVSMKRDPTYAYVSGGDYRITLNAAEGFATKDIHIHDGKYGFVFTNETSAILDQVYYFNIENGDITDDGLIVSTVLPGETTDTLYLNSSPVYFGFLYGNLIYLIKDSYTLDLFDYSSVVFAKDQDVIRIN